MYKFRRKLFIGIFVGVLVGPMISYPFVKKYIDTENYENRELVEKPELAATTIKDYPALYEDYFNDHLPYKNQLQFINNMTDFFVFHDLNSDRVLLGKDEWLFYKAEGCLDDYRGIRAYSQTELEEMKNNLQIAQAWFADHNIQMIVNIVPNKHEVYSEKLPDEIVEVNPVSMSEQAVSYIKNNSDMDIFYDLDKLKKAAENYQVYYKYDTHWNYVGGYYGTISLMEVLGKTMDVCKQEDIVPWNQDIFATAPQQSGKKYDLAMMIGMPNFLDADRDKKYMVNYKPQIQFTFETLASYSDIDTMLYHSNAEDERNIMMVCDSFGNLNMPYIAKEFKNASCIHYNHYECGFMEKYQPDIVIFQFVERQAYRFDQKILEVIGIEES